MIQLLLGPVLGLLGSSIGSIFKWLDRKEEAKLQAQQHLHERELLKLQIDARVREREDERLLAETSGIVEAIKGAYEHDASYGPVSQGAAAWLRWVRPALTFFLIGLTAVIFASTEEIDLRLRVINSVLMMSEAAVTFWFLDRSKLFGREK